MAKNGRRRSRVKRKIREVFRTFANRLRGRRPSPESIQSYTKVKSSNVHGVAYDPKKKILTVKFKDRLSRKPASTYQYFNVPRTVHSKLLKEHEKRAKKGKKFGSVGGYFTKHVRNKYSYERLK